MRFQLMNSGWKTGAGGRKGGWGEASSAEMWFGPAGKGADGFGAGFARGQRGGPGKLHRGKF